MAVDLFDRVVGDTRLRAVVSDRNDGDFHPHRVAPDRLDTRQRALIGRRFSMVDQIHGTAVRNIGGHAGRHEGRHGDGDGDGGGDGNGGGNGGGEWPVVGIADVIVSDAPKSTPVGVWAADCAPIVLFGAAGTVVGAHAGWRGLAAGVVDVAVDALSGRGESVVAAIVGPTIHAECYAFGDTELAAVADGVGVDVEMISAVTSDGRVALDVPAAVTAALRQHDVEPDVVGDCTGCGRRWFSHRVRADTERHVLVAWIEPAHATVGS